MGLDPVLPNFYYECDFSFCILCIVNYPNLLCVMSREGCSCCMSSSVLSLLCISHYKHILSIMITGDPIWQISILELCKQNFSGLNIPCCIV